MLAADLGYTSSMLTDAMSFLTYHRMYAVSFTRSLSEVSVNTLSR